MSAPPLKKVVANCLNKRRYPDEMTARAAAMTYLDHPENYLNGLDKLWVYKCHECNRWHTTSRSKSKRWLVTRTEPIHSQN